MLAKLIVNHTIFLFFLIIFFINFLFTTLSLTYLFYIAVFQKNHVFSWSDEENKIWNLREEGEANKDEYRSYITQIGEDISSQRK